MSYRALTCAAAAAVVLLATAPAAPAASRLGIARAALSQQGVHEGQRNCNRYGPCAEWCAMFATWVWQRAGVPGVPRGIQRARGLGLWATDKGLFKPRAPGTDGHPEVGDWVVWGAPSARGQGHVDVVTRVGGGRIDVIGGNLDDAVRLRTIDPATATVRRAGQRLAVSGYATPPGLGASPPGEPAGTTPGSLDGVVAVTRGVGQLDVFVRGGSFALMHRHWNGRAWGPWVSLGGQLDSEPAAVVTAAGRRIDVVARGTRGTMMVNTWTSARAGWTGWRDTGGGRITSSPSLTSRTPGTLDAFALTGDNVVSHRHMYGDRRWGPWVRLGRSASSGPAAIASNGADRLNVLVRDLDGSLLSRMWTRAHGWYHWVDRGGRIVGRPTVTTRTPTGYALDVFTRAQPTLALQHWHSGDGARFIGPVSLGGALFGTPSAASWGPGRIDVFSRNSVGELVQRIWTVARAGWYPYVGLGSTPAPPQALPVVHVLPPRPPGPTAPDAAPARGAVRQPRPWSAASRYQALVNLDGRRTPRLRDRAVVDHVNGGQWAQIECQTLGERAYGSRIWDRVRGLYVPDRFVRTYTNGFLRGAPRCGRAVGAPPLGPPPRVSSRRSCDDTRENVSTSVGFRQRRELFVYDKTMVPALHLDEVDTLTPMGDMRIGAATCKHGRGWRVLSPLQIEYSSAGLDRSNQPTGTGPVKGLGISVVDGRGPAATGRPYIDVAPIACRKGVFWTILNEVIGEVLPEWLEKGSKSAGRLVLARLFSTNQVPFLTDKLKCRELARYRVSVAATASGRLRSEAETLRPYRLQTEQALSGYEGVVNVNGNIVQVTRWTTEAG